MTDYETRARALVAERLAYYGYTPEQITDAMTPITPLEHRALGCELTEHGWDCTDDEGAPRHPLHDEADAAAEWVTWVLDRLEL